MRIQSANIPAQTHSNSSAPGSHAVDRAIERRKASAGDTYAKDSPQQPSGIIDAEYVELYTPSAILKQERFSLDSTIEPPELSAPAPEYPARSAAPPVESYQRLAAPDTPRPGIFIDIFA